MQNGKTFAKGDYVFLRAEMGVISETGTDSFVNQPYIEVENPFSFVPDEGEQIAFCFKSNPAFPSQIQYYCFYLNKPKVVRIEIHDSLPEGTGYWKRIDYEYNYSVQGSNITDGFVDGGFNEDNVEGPSVSSFDASDITVTQTVITTGISNIFDDRDLTKDVITFSYDEKSFHKGQSSEQKLRISDDSKSWLFVSKTVKSLGKPCANAGFYGVMTSFDYEGGNPAIVSDGGASWRKSTNYRYDAYGRPVRITVVSPSFELKKSQTTWKQYVGSSNFLAQEGTPDLDPLNKFSGNYLSNNYQQVFNAFYAMGLVGATVEEVDAYGALKTVYNQYDLGTGNLLMTDVTIASSLIGSGDMYSANMPNFRAVYGSTIVTDPTQIDWSYQGSPLSNNWTNAIFEESGLSGIVSHARTYYAYDASTNNLLQITKPNGNTINLSYGSGWLSSYVASDYKTLDTNILGATQYVVTSYTYDVKGRLTSKTVRFKSDTLANDTNLYVYGSSAPKTMTQYTYDGMDRLLTKAVGDGTTQTAVLQIQYLDSGDGSWADPYMIVTDYLGFRTKSYYDSRYRLVFLRRFKPNQSIGGNLSYSSSWEVKISAEQNIYDIATGKVFQNIKFTNSNEDSNQSITQYTYDSIGRLTEVDSLNSDIANYQGDSVFKTLKLVSYDESVNAVITQEFVDSASGNYVQTRIENDWLGRGPVKEISWPALNGAGTQIVTVNHYRSDGKLIKKQLPNKALYFYDYDNLGKLEKITYPDGTRIALLYDFNGNLIQTIDRRNLSTSVVYNKADLPISKTSLDNVRGNTVVSTTYTQFGPAAVIKAEGVSNIVQDNYWYHFSGGCIMRQQIIDGYTMEVDATYDPAGNQLTITPIGSGSSPWTNTFNILPQYHAANPDNDHFNRSAISDNSSGNNLVTHEPDFLGLGKTIKYGSYSSPVASVAQTYDKFLRLLTILSSEATPNLNITSTRDFIGNVLSHSEPALAPVPAINNSYVYDGMTRLLSGEGIGETYDQLSNLTAQGASSYIYQNPSQSASDQMRLASFNNGSTLFAYGYDANGNPTSITNRFSLLSYDNLNCLRQGVYSQTDNYWYDDAGLRVKKTENAGGTWKTTYTLYDGNNPLLQEVYTVSGRIQTAFNIILGGKIPRAIQNGLSLNAIGGILLPGQSQLTSGCD